MYTIDESLSDTDFTPAKVVAHAFGTGRSYESITVHHWGSFGQTHDGVVDFFMRPNSPTSCHFVASDSRIHCLVSPMDASWAAGNAYGNATSIHIEARPEATDGDYATVAWLIAHLRSLYGDLPLKPHNAWAATACPGKWDLARLDREARNTATPAPQSGTITPIPKEDTLSKAEVDEITASIASMEEGLRNYTAALLIRGYETQGRKFPGIGMVVMENQRRINTSNAKLAALQTLVQQLATQQGVDIDYGRIDASIKTALADGIEISGTFQAKGEEE